ncbi:sulfur carrier protein ThiS [Microbacterium halophytorum]|uniref:sulfur carrier protein ThiS n=1 Tax=Microbacterium halophytorum TaxID=2067568 RepID=UPI000CFDA7C7|nr:sulfur carrier protein ThiS [Microbacterium halophytorum]
MITVLLNGSPTQLGPDRTVAGLVADLTGRDIRPDGSAADGAPVGVAVAVNAAVVPRSTWGAAALSGGDEVEVLTAVQGG